MTQWSMGPFFDDDAGEGTVTSVGLAAPSIFTVFGSPVTSSGTLTFVLNPEAPNTVFAGPATGAANVPTFRLLTVSDLPTSNFTDVGTDGITITGGTNAVIGSGTTIAQHVSDSTHNGYLSSTDWTTFNSKQPAGSYITALTTDVVAAGPGSVVATIQPNVVTNAKLAQAPTHTVKGNNTAGTANVADLTMAQLLAMLVPLSGSQFITSGTTYTTPANITTSTRFKFTLIGGGGGGAGTATANAKGSGGGAAGVGVLILSGLSPSTAYTIAIGAPGAGGDNTPNPGNAGGTTSLTIGATTYTAVGGGGGPAGNNQIVGGIGGTTTNCTISIVGQNGQGTGTANAATVSSNGGNSGLGWGLGGQGQFTFFGNDGYNATGYGGGGGGGTSAVGIGGYGSPGAIFVEWNS